MGDRDLARFNSKEMDDRGVPRSRPWVDGAAVKGREGGVGAGAVAGAEAV